jgi:gamma-glutamyltranspeptidase/glutathione hydrolase
MLRAKTARRGMVTAPHHLAAEAGVSVLRDGGNAVEAMVAAASAIAVVYPHMNAIGGDGFWLIHSPGADPIAVDACGAAGQGVDDALYAGHDAIPSRGPLAANTVAGTISGWQAALDTASSWGTALPLSRLLEDAIHYAEIGFPLTGNQHGLTTAKLDELRDVPGFAETFLADGVPPVPGTHYTNPRLGRTLRRLAQDGLDGFYRGDLARDIAADLAAAGSPITGEDLARHAARVVAPLSVRLSMGTAYNLPPPTQGVASLMILALFERLGVNEAEGFDFLHGLVESTKQAFLLRDGHVADPDVMDVDPQSWLDSDFLDGRAKKIDPKNALPWPQPSAPGDTVWLGAIDGEGRAVSFIQSIYWEFGSGVVLGDTGILWQNRGSSFALHDGPANRLAPGRRPFHTLNPALARLDDGRVMVYGTMGGEGQPQTQAAVFARHVMYGQDLQAAVTAPRWLLGRTWGAETTTLKLESRFSERVVSDLEAAGHDVEIVDPFSDMMGHAGGLVRHADGRLEGASDPRSDGGVAAF